MVYGAKATQRDPDPKKLKQNKIKQKVNEEKEKILQLPLEILTLLS